MSILWLDEKDFGVAEEVSKVQRCLMGSAAFCCKNEVYVLNENDMKIL